MIEFITQDFISKINNVINVAESKIEIAVAWISFDQFSDALIGARKRGVNVKIIYDDNNSNNKQVGSISKLKANNIEMLPIKMPGYINHMHEKMAIIDNKLLIGSYNWTSNAMKNFENLLIISNEQQIINEAKCEFQEIEIYSNSLKTMTKKEKDDGNEIVNLLLQKNSTSHGGTEGFEIYLIRLDKSNKVISRDLWESLGSSLFPEYDEGNEEEIYIENHLVCAVLANKNSIKHSIDGVISGPFCTTEMDGEITTVYKCIWRNRFTNCAQLEYSADEIE